MKILLLNLVALAILLSGSIAYSQNLAPNPSFEEYLDCPVSLSTLRLPMVTATVIDWYKPTRGTSDYFNSCATIESMASVPENVAGYQHARTGEGYVGWLGYVSCSREYIEAKLLTPMIAGHKYHVSYWVSLADSIALAIDQMGAFFSPDSVNEPTVTTLLAVTPQVVSPVDVMYNDTAGWQQVSGTYIAAGGEEWVIIGNFTPEADLSMESMSSGGSSSYYYTDDVCIVDMDSAAPEDIGIHDTLRCDNEELQFEGRAGMGNFLWDDGSTGATRTIALNGTYWVRSLDSSNCRMLVDTFIVRGKPGPPLSLGNDTILCALPPFVLVPQVELDEPGESLSWLWSGGSNDETLSVDSSGTYWVLATTETGCWSADTIEVLYYNVRQYLGEDIFLCWGDRVNIPLQANMPAGATAYWNNGASSPGIIATDTGTYSVIVNQPPCMASDTIIIAYEKCTCWNEVPTAFTPNSDGINDVFVPVIEAGCPITNYMLSIFNRWGQRIFVGYTPETSWDGTYNGKPADAGTYMYELQFTGGTRDNRYIKKGDVHLLR